MSVVVVLIVESRMSSGSASWQNLVVIVIIVGGCLSGFAVPVPGILSQGLVGRNKIGIRRVPADSGGTVLVSLGKNDIFPEFLVSLQNFGSFFRNYSYKK